MNLTVVLAVLAALTVNVASTRRSPRRQDVTYSDVPSETCRTGDGSSYRGYVSRSRSGRRCLNWDVFIDAQDASKGLGNHNYCRNPNHSARPWCYVQRSGRKREFCNIPTCSIPAKPRSPPPAAVDTELTCGERTLGRMHKIVGGSFTPIESHPWVAAIFRSSRADEHFVCGGSLIAPCWVLTAAHCFPDNELIEINHLSVYLGKTAINETDAGREQKFIVEKVIIHQKYNKTTYDNDIALLKIKSINGGCAVKAASARTVCLPPALTQLPPASPCSIAGFGKERNAAWHYSQYLKQATVRLISQTDCRSESFYGDLITNNMMCAGSPTWSTDACKGDSGGPLVCEVSGRMFLFGVVSWGDGCARINKPGVYTQVTNYNKWIAANTGLSKYTAGKMYPQK